MIDVLRYSEVKSVLKCGLEERLDHSQTSDKESGKMVFGSRNEL